MKILKILGLTCASMIAISGNAAEACKAYIKLDLGQGFSSNTRVYGSLIKPSSGGVITISRYSSGLDKDQNGMIGDLAVGYAFNDAMRGEVSFDFKPKMVAHGYNFNLETQEYGGSARVLYDFNNNTAVTPFVFGGLGAVNIKPKVKPFASGLTREYGVPYIGQINSDGTYKTDTDGKIVTYSSLKMPSKTVMTYQAGVGLSLKASEQISIDLTYGLGGKTNYQVLVNTAAFSIPAGSDITPANAKVKTNFKQLKFKNQMDQSLTLGVRFTI